MLLPLVDSSWLPRTRGDGPLQASGTFRATEASPHPRGWTAACRSCQTRSPGFPAPAGMDPQMASPVPTRIGLPRTRGDGPPQLGGAKHEHVASPHPRGWTSSVGALSVALNGFPAPAGMDLSGRIDGLILNRLPRTRGDGPHCPSSSTSPCSAFPHPRGWTRDRQRARTGVDGFPAPAGMDPSR